jgi:CubicO group peptidase (beta-lactamase class C family)
MLAGCTQSFENDLEEELRSIGVDSAQPLEASIELVRDHYALPAIAVAVVGPDSVLQVVVSGMSGTDTGYALTAHDRFDLNSVTKSFTGLLVAELVARGSLTAESRLDSLFGRSAPGLHEGYRDATLGDVLRHRAGLSRNGENIALDSRPTFSGTVRSRRQQFAEWILSHEPHYPTGEYHYSNAGYVVIAAAIENIAGSSWEAEVERRIFRPLGFDSAGFGWPGELPMDFAVGHSRVSAEVCKPRGPDGAWYPLDLAFPAGGIHMSINDFARYVQFHLSGLQGKNASLPQGLFSQIHDTTEGYGFGWFPSEFESYPGCVHDGSDDGYYSKAFVDSKGRLGVAVLTNIDDENAWKACNIVTLVALQKFSVK